MSAGDDPGGFWQQLQRGSVTFGGDLGSGLCFCGLGTRPHTCDSGAGLLSLSLYIYICIYICAVHAKSLQLCPTLCDPLDYSLPGSSVHGILQARILEWVAVPSSRGSSQFRDRTRIFCGFYIAGRFLTVEPLGKPHIYIYVFPP